MSEGVHVVQDLMETLLQYVRENRYMAAFNSLQEIEKIALGACSSATKEHIQVMMFEHREELTTLRSRYHEIMNLTHP